ncbi:NADH dehydrogenase (quinone), G subunit [Candida albicans P57072]|nr:NADH dehydrogenase (quinone), G subunit [Candida albicans P94015]KGQ80747.1 NADH dehydrogenase (quinone), G subunit [Candida albicans GC75]KGQ99833.1 NADH dehydrogenase (quinone), G subunit [Candida albicans P57072]KGU00621.1 NADH dehydrogenase (quinone), G subunit [Candida albicans P87]KGU20412.1 NADH dehydrogenase (quinone), G subunit [Candida albicans P57055]KGU20921.1 NADH dehydrogenase (quinone), G subunit [Candida albicans P75063]KHC27506.1 NADH dehydrogenase (quinone), G subunit [Ca
MHSIKSHILRSSKRYISASSKRLAEVEVTVDGRKVSIEAGSSIIQAAELAGVTIPRYCYHDKLAIAGNCRMCLVDVERMPKLIASCAMPVQNGMVVHTDSERIKKAREGVTEMLLENHPLDCPVCDQGGECDLQEQSQRYGSDRGRFHEVVGKRAVENKAIGPLVKTSMNRCIHCTRCVRFMNDVAGAPEFGTAGRGNDMQIGTYIERNINSEMSGNIIDLCPVGALTSKPYAFRARPWELKRTETIDVLDAVGSNIRVDTRGIEVMRVLPRLNDDVNEEWISDKTRFACDGLKTQRLTTPLIRNGDKFETATWDEALSTIAAAYSKINPQNGELKAIAGALVDAESLVSLKDLVNKLGSENVTTDVKQSVNAHGFDIRSNYIFNSTIDGIEDADQILLVGTNPRFEAAVLNTRIRKVWLRSNLEISSVGQDFNSTFDVTNLGEDAKALESALQGSVGEKLGQAKKPLIIVGSGVAESKDSEAIYKLVGEFASKHENFNSGEWNGVNLLHREASRVAALDLGFNTLVEDSTKAKFIYLLGADEITNKDIPKDAFVVYQGHHGDLGASFADVILPGSAYTEKSGTYVNTEGRVQATRAATNPPGVAREDWKIIRALSEYLNAKLPYDDIYSVRLRLGEIAPHLVRHDVIEPVSQEIAKIGFNDLVNKNKSATIFGEPLKNPIDNFYFTDVISRSSPTMAKCISTFGAKIEKVKDEKPDINF